MILDRLRGQRAGLHRCTSTSAISGSLCNRTRTVRAPLAVASHPRALARDLRRDADRPGILHALSRRFSWRGAPARRPDARRPGRARLAARCPDAVRARRRGAPAAGRRLGRPAARRALPRGGGAGAAVAARDVARAVARGPADARRPQPARRVGAARQYAVRAGAPLQPAAARGVTARRDVHTAGLERGALPAPVGRRCCCARRRRGSAWGRRCRRRSPVSSLRRRARS